MAKTKGIHSHPIFKLGKGKARRDKRNLQFRSILKKAVAIPDEWDYDLDHRGIPLPMFGNDRYGDCVIAGRAHQTLRFENMEQKGAVLAITEKVVVNEYFRQTGGSDDGLIVLDSIKLWRTKGWKIKSRPYRIKAFAELDRTNYDELKLAIINNIGIGIGVGLPITAADQFQAGQPWDYIGGSGSQPWSWGGHYIHIPGYTRIGPVCVTWGQKQQLTWSFFDHYCDEAYAIVDALNRFRKSNVIDAPKIEQFLQSL